MDEMLVLDQRVVHNRTVQVGGGAKMAKKSVHGMAHAMVAHTKMK